jgi:hypothetical protein
MDVTNLSVAFRVEFRAEDNIFLAPSCMDDPRLQWQTYLYRGALYPRFLSSVCDAAVPREVVPCLWR